MKKSELIQKLIEIEREKGENATITLNYIDYLEKIKKFIQEGDKELE